MILSCTCPVRSSHEIQDMTASEFQHKRYKGKRVHTPMKKQGFIGRCTVCGTEKRSG